MADKAQSPAATAASDARAKLDAAPRVTAGGQTAEVVGVPHAAMLASLLPEGFGMFDDDSDGDSDSLVLVLGVTLRRESRGRWTGYLSNNEGTKGQARFRQPIAAATATLLAGAALAKAASKGKPIAGIAPADAAAEAVAALQK